MRDSCPVCAAPSERKASIPFDVSLDSDDSPTQELRGVSVDYFQCGACGHAFAPWMLERPPEWFASHIYNADYSKYDEDYADDAKGRSQEQARALIYQYHFARKNIRHLDYGSGEGHLTKRMQAAGFDSTAYDPFSSPRPPVGGFNLITGFEVIEHAPDPHRTLSEIAGFSDAACLIRLGTLANDGEDIRTWWYANPRFGHINLFSTRSMLELARRHQFSVGVVENCAFFLWRKAPEWAKC